MLDDPQRADADLQRSIVHARLFGGDDAPRIGRYRVVDTIGEGGMGTVYKGLDEKLDRHVALKRLKTVEATASQRERIIREARALGKLAHPNIVAIFEIAEHEDALFFAMEYVPGPTLREWARDHEPAWREVVEHYLQAGRALAAAHAAGLVHRDFKPQNAIVGDDGRVRVLDFGLVSAAGHIDEQTSTAPVGEGDLTETGAVLGTPAYIAPEQLRPGRVDHRADQFSFCVSLYEALYGERPFAGLPGLDPDARLRRGASNGPKRLRAVLERGLALEPIGRFDDMTALLEALQTVLRRRTWFLAAGMFAVAASVAGSALERHQDAPCDSRLAPSRAWNAEHRRAIADGFAASGLPFAEIASARIQRRLDEWADAWSLAHREACLDTHVRRVASEARLDARMDCLAVQERTAQGLTQLLSKADNEIVVRSDSVLAGLPSPTACGRAAKDATSVDQREATRRAFQQLSLALARVRAAKTSEAEAAYHVLASNPLLATTPALEVGVARLHAELTYSQSGIGKAVAVWRDAGHEAQKHRLDSLAAEILLDLAEHAVGELAQADAERWLLEDAEAAVSRLGDEQERHRARVALLRTRFQWNHGQAGAASASLRAALRTARSDERRLVLTAELGCALRENGESEEARAMFLSALELARSASGRDSLRVAQLLRELGKTAVETGREKEAADALERARAILEELTGPLSLEVARTRMVLAQLYATQGQFEAAASQTNSALATFRERLDPGSPVLAEAYNAHGVLAFRRDDHAGATRSWRKALQIQRSVDGDTSPAVALLRSNIAESQLALGQYGYALETFEDALSTLRQHRKQYAPELGAAMKGYGVALFVLGRTTDAVDALQGARDHLTGYPFERAEATYALSVALRLTDPARSAVLRQEAIAEFSRLEATGAERQLAKLLEQK